VADELKITKIALGHHRDDMLQTFFLNMFFGGKLKGMPPKLVSDDGGKLSARPADDALAALDKSWDAAFAYPPA
jgi:tRNA 2-thiocytidine biosynthesis protein TtcA